MIDALIFCAHPDDEIVAMGGTIAKYAREGKQAVVVIFSYGESSQPLVKKDIIVKARVLESLNIGKHLGSKETIFLGIPDGRIIMNTSNGKLLNDIAKLIEKYKPAKIFTHSASEWHIDHRAVYTIVRKALTAVKEHYYLYTFSIWNPFTIIHRNRPKLYIDISNVFKKKLDSMKLFHSQQHFIYPLLPIMRIRARLYGWQNKCKYAEKFYKIT